METYEEPEKIDRLAEKILSALFKQGRSTTSELKMYTGGESRSIRHRIDEWLAPAGLVKECGRKPHPGNDVREFKLTTSGHRYVSDKWDDLAHYAERDELAETGRQLNDRMDLMHDYMDEIDGRVGGVKDDVEETQEKVKSTKNELKAELEALRQRVDELEAENEDLERRLGEVNERSKQNKTRSKRTKQIAEEAWGWAWGEWISSVRNPEPSEAGEEPPDPMPWMDIGGKLRRYAEQFGPDEWRPPAEVGRAYREWEWGDD